MSIDIEKKEPIEADVHAVLYTDGGCKPSRGIGGWGMHGYLFTNDPAKQGTGNPKFNPSPQGYILKDSGKPDITIKQYIDGFGSLIPESTNNIAEVTAALRALETARHHNVKSVQIRMDSTYALDGISSRMFNWANQGWDKPGGIANVELWKQIYDVRKSLEANGIIVELVKVKGHSGDFGNDLADMQATRGVIAGRNKIDIEHIKLSDAQGYWGAKAPRSRLFSHANWYFGAQQEERELSPDGRYVYYLGDPREEEELFGKKISDATFSILYLTQPEPVLELIRGAVARMGFGRYQGLSVASLSNIFKPQVYNEILEFGDTLLDRDYANQVLTTATDLKLSQEIKPARLAYQAVDALRTLEMLLQEYLNPSAESRVRTTDLTTLLYESDTTKKKVVYRLKSHVTSALRSLEVEANYYTKAQSKEPSVDKLVLTLAIDLPDRNTLSALAGEATRVTLLTWPESAHAIRYATVIEVDGDAGIWSGIYSNLHVLAS